MPSTVACTNCGALNTGDCCCGVRIVGSLYETDLTRLRAELEQARSVARKLAALVTTKPLGIYHERYPWLEGE